jgi:hypothetical protein
MAKSAYTSRLRTEKDRNCRSQTAMPCLGLRLRGLRYIDCRALESRVSARMGRSSGSTLVRGLHDVSSWMGGLRCAMEKHTLEYLLTWL